MPSRPVPSADINIHVRTRPASSASAGPSYIALWLRVLSEKRLKIIMHAMVRICKPFKKLIFFIFPFRRIENVCLYYDFNFFSISFFWMPIGGCCCGCFISRTLAGRREKNSFIDTIQFCWQITFFFNSFF